VGTYEKAALGLEAYIKKEEAELNEAEVRMNKSRTST